MSDEERGQVERFEMGPGSELSVSSVSGRTTVRAEEGSEIVVKASKRGSSRSKDNTQVDIRKDGNKVSVQTRMVTVGLMNFGRSSSVDYNITVPKDCMVRVHAVSASVDVSGPRADVGVQTVSGDAHLRDVAGDISMTTVSGDIHAKNISGTLVARTTSGDGHFLSSRLRRFSLSTVSGDFVIETPLIADEHSQAKTVSGDLELLVPPDTGATVQLKSISGSVSCELPAEIIKAGRRHWQGRINGGGSHVEMNSVSGDLRIRREGSATMEHAGHADHGHHDTSWTPRAPRAPRAPMPPAPPAPPAPSGRDTDLSTWGVINGENPAAAAATVETSDRTGEILEAVEKGELTVEEAMAKLEEVGA